VKIFKNPLLGEDHEGRVKNCYYLRTMKNLQLSGQDSERSPCCLVKIMEDLLLHDEDHEGSPVVR
jgi:hypothetical protein